MIKRHPVITVLVVAVVAYMLVTAPVVLVDGLQAIGGFAAKIMDSAILAVQEFGR